MEDKDRTLYSRYTLNNIVPSIRFLRRTHQLISFVGKPLRRQWWEQNAILTIPPFVNQLKRPTYSDLGTVIAKDAIMFCKYIRFITWMIHYSTRRNKYQRSYLIWFKRKCWDDFNVLQDVSFHGPWRYVG